VKIKLLADYRGHLTNEQYYTAGEWDLPAAIAGALVEAGRAVQLKPDAPTGEKRRLPGVDEKIANALWQAGYKTLQAIADASDDELLAVSGIGKARIAQIREALNDLL
jgi:hypothetical protein